MQSHKRFVGLVMLALLFLFPSSLLCQTSAKAISYAVPYFSQISYGGYSGFADWGQSACGPTAIAMVLSYYYPGAKIGVPEVYSAGTQTPRYAGPLVGYRSVGFPPTPPAQSWPGTAPNTGLDNVPSAFRQYFTGTDAGMDPSYAVIYLAHVLGGTASVQYPTIAGLMNELANGPFVVNVDETNRQGTHWGAHYVVLTGYDPTTMLFSINDPYVPFSSYWGSSPINEKVSLAELTTWYKGRALVYRPDASLSTNGRKYTMFVDNGDNNDGISTECAPGTNCFSVDTPNNKTAAGLYVWQKLHHNGYDYAFPLEAGHTSRWKPLLTASGYYEIQVRTYAAQNAGVTRYSLHDASGQELTVRYINQNTTAIDPQERIASFGTFFLTSGAYVDAAMATNAPADAVSFLDRDNPSGAARPQAAFTLTANGKTNANNQSVQVFTAKGTPLAIALNALASQAGNAASITSFDWFEGNQQLTTGATPTITLAPGTHTIILQVTNSLGLAASTAATIVVTEAAQPTPAFTITGGGKTGANNQSLALTVAHGSTIPITFNAGTSQPGYGSLSYLWQNGSTTMSTLQTFTTNLGAGVYTITLRTTNTANLTATTSGIISITENAMPPTANFTFTGSGKNGGINMSMAFTTAPGTTIPISFNGTASTPGTGTLTYAWFYNGVSLTALPSFTATFGPGNYTMLLRVTNTAGLSATAAATIIITAAIPPTAAFTFTGGGKTGANNQTVSYTVAHNGSVAVTFNAATSKPGSAPITSWVWQSNGTTISTSASLTYNLGTPSNTITLRVTDSNGQTSTATAVITVKAQ